jgi:hypothetical protein
MGLSSEKSLLKFLMVERRELPKKISKYMMSVEPERAKIILGSRIVVDL